MREVIPIASLDDPHVAPYRNLKDRDLLARAGERPDAGLFIAEGEHVVKRLLASSYETESVLLSEQRVEEIAPLVPADVPVYVTRRELMHEIVGFKFHSGVLAAGRRPKPQTIDEVVPKDKSDLLLVVLPEVASVENIGSLVRIAAGFAADALVLGQHCHDPFFRQAIRVSMGTVFSGPPFTE